MEAFQQKVLTLKNNLVSVETVFLSFVMIRLFGATGAALAEIGRRRLSDIICENTDLSDLQAHVFIQVHDLPGSLTQVVIQV